jgi:hypothetical protein
MNLNTDLIIEDIPSMPEVIQALNYQLSYLGVLDPEFIVDLKNVPGPLPVKNNQSKFNRKWTLDSMTALRQWMALNQTPILDSEVIKPEQLYPLFEAKPAVITPADNYPDTMLAYNIAMRMEKEGFYINRGLGINTAYVEGVNLDGTLNKDRPDEWNDLCIWFTVNPKGILRFLGKALCTTEPGRFYTVNPLNNKGAARIAFGQYKAWVAGLHKNIQPALVQAGGIKVHRDTDRSMTRSAKDTIQIVYASGINQHTTGPRVQSALVGKYSAGCLVKHDYDVHISWLDQVKQDYRFVGNIRYMHVAAIMAGPI